MKTKFYLLLAVVGLHMQLSAQLSGQITDEHNNQPVVGATIETSDKQTTTTDEYGRFSLPCAKGMSIEIKKSGFMTEEYTIDDCDQTLNVKMRIRVQELIEISITQTLNKDKEELNQPVSVVRLGTQEIKRGNGLYLMDAVNTNTPGVTMQSRTTSGGQQFNIRGYGNGARGTKGVSSNFDGQGTKVYLNGIPITNSEGVAIMDDIDFASLGNVEIIKGPSGTLYGNAIAGVVNLQTAKATPNETSMRQSTLIGSYGLLRSTTQVAIGTNRSSFLLNYSVQRFDGFMEHTATKKGFVNMIGDLQMNAKQSISYYLGYSDGYDQRNGELTIGQYDTLDYSGNPDYIKNDAHSAAQTLRAGISHRYEFAPYLSNTTSVFGSAQDLDNSSAGGWNDVNNYSFGARSTFDTRFKLGKKIYLNGNTGFEVQRTSSLAINYKMGADSTNLDGYNTILSVKTIGSTVSLATNVFSQWTLSLPAQFDFTAGIGYNRMDISFTDRLWAASNNKPGNAVPKTFATSYADMLSPTIALNKVIARNFSVYASYSIAYKAPVASFIYIPQTGALNTDLVPEKGTQIEVGTKGRVLNERLYYTLAFFNAKFADKFTTVTVQNPQNTATLFAYVRNGGALNNSGVEALIQFEIISRKDGVVKSLKPFVNATYSMFKYEDFRYETVGDDINGNDSTIVNDYSDKVVAGVPPLVLNAGIDFEARFGLYANVVFNYRDAMYFTSDNMNQAAAYYILNAKLGYRKEFGKFGLDAYLGAINLTSQQYYAMVFVNQLPDAYLPAPREINFFGGLNLKYRF